MVIKHPDCPLCGSENISEYLKAKDHLLTHETFTINKCASCAFVFTQGTPAVDEIGRYYQSHDYVSHSDTRKGLMNKIYHLGRSLMLRKKYGMVQKGGKGQETAGYWLRDRLFSGIYEK